MTSNRSVGDLELVGGGLEVPQSLTLFITRQFQWTAGQLSGTGGTTQLEAGATLALLGNTVHRIDSGHRLRLEPNSTLRAEGSPPGTRVLANEGILENWGAILVDEGVRLNVSGTVLQRAGRIVANGNIVFHSGQFNFEGGALLGAVRALDTSVLVAETVTEPSTLRISGNTGTLRGNQSPSVTLWLEASPTFGAAVLNLAGVVSNRGRIHLESSDNNAPECAVFLLPEALLRNESTGIVEAGKASDRASSIYGTLENHGKVMVANQAKLNITRLSNWSTVHAATNANLTILAGCTQSAGLIHGDGLVLLQSGPFDFRGGRIDGHVTAYNCPISIASTVTDPSILQVVGNSGVLRESASPAVTLRLEANTTYGFADLKITNTLTHRGTLELVNNSPVGHASSLTVSKDHRLVVAPGAGLHTTSTTVGTAYLVGNVENRGTLSATRNTTFLTGEVVNWGTILVDDTSRMTVQSGLRQRGGLLRADGPLTVQSSVFQFTGGRAQGQVQLSSTSIQIADTVREPSTIRIIGVGNLLDSNLSPEVTLWVESNPRDGRAELGVPKNTLNRGQILLELPELPGHSSTLSIKPGAVLTNASTGVIKALAKAGGQTHILGRLDNFGTIHSGLGTSLQIFPGPEGRFLQKNGVLEGLGELIQWNGHFDFAGGSNLARFSLYDSRIEVAESVVSESTLRIVGTTCVLLGNRSPATSLWIDGNRQFSSAELRILSPVANAGTLRLEPSDPDFASSIRCFGVGTLLNEPTGVISARSQYKLVGTLAFYGPLENRGTLHTDSGSRLDLYPSASATFLQHSGSIQGDGDVIQWNGLFEFKGGSITTRFFNYDTRISVAPTVNVASTLRIVGASCELLSNDSAWVTLSVEANTQYGPAELKIRQSATNHGTILLEHSSPSAGSSTLRISEGAVLANAPSGTIRSVAGGEGSYAVHGTLHNRGQLRSDAATLLQLFPGTGNSIAQLGGSIRGEGEIAQWNGSFRFTGGQLHGSVFVYDTQIDIADTVEAASTLNVYGPGNVLLQNASPSTTLRIVGGTRFGAGRLALVGSITNRGTLVFEGQPGGFGASLHVPSAFTLLNAPTGVIQLVPGSNNSFSGEGAFENTGRIRLAGGTLNLDIQTLVNERGAIIEGHGLINNNRDGFEDHGVLRPGSPLGTLLIQGEYRQRPSGRLEIELAGTNAPAQYDRLEVRGTSHIEGSIAVQLQNEFDPGIGDSFRVASWNTRSGEFTQFEGLAFQSNRSFTATYDSTGLDLKVIATSDPVSVPPSIAVQPSDQVVPNGQTARFQVTANGTRPLAYQWFFEDTEIPGATNLTLQLPNAQTNRTGNYRVVVSNAAGTLSSQIARLLVRPIADLVVLDLSHPLSAIAGQLTSVSWQIRNRGAQSASAPWINALGFSTNASGIPAFHLGHWSNLSPLAAGQELASTQSVIFPAGLAGTFYLTASVDFENDVPDESDETNNDWVAPTPIQVLAPDLGVASTRLTSPTGQSLANVTSGIPVRVSWVTTNLGTGPVTVAWTNHVFISSHSNSLAGAYFLGSVVSNQSPLDSNQSMAQQLEVTPPLTQDFAAGDFYLLIVLDANQDIAESDEQNNLASIPIQVVRPPLPNLTVYDIQADRIVTSASELTLGWRIQNTGERAATGPWVETVSLVGDATPEIVIQRLIHETPLRAGESLERTLQVPFPPDIAGDFKVSVTVDAEDTVLEQVEVDNRQIASLPTSFPPKLILLLPSELITEGNAPIRARLSRTGSVASQLVASLSCDLTNAIQFPSIVPIPAGSASVEFLIQPLHDDKVTGRRFGTLTAEADVMVSAGWQLTWIDTDTASLSLRLESNSVLEGQSLRATVSRSLVTTNILRVVLDTPSRELIFPVTVEIPGGAAEVSFAIIAEDNDRLQSVREIPIVAHAIDHSESSAILRVHEDDGPDLAVELNPNRVSEDAGAFSVIGRVSRTRAIHRDLTVSLQSDGSGSLQFPSQVTIPAGASSAQFPLSILDDTQVNGTRTYHITASAGEIGQLPLAESSPTTLTITDNDGPSLILQPSTSLAREGQSLRGSVSRNSDFALPLSVTLSSSDPTILSMASTAHFDAGTTNAFFDWQAIDNGRPDGNRQVSIVAEASGFAPAISTLTVTDTILPDLVIGDVEIPATGLTGDTLNVRYRVTNQGSAKTTGSFRQRIYLSSDLLIDPADVLLDQTPFAAPLEPGQSFARVVSSFLPPRPGDFWVIVVCDADEGVVEILESNNASASVHRIQVLPAYVATVETDIQTLANNTPVPLKGRAVRPNGSPAAFEPISIHVAVRGTHRVLGAITDANGSYETIFSPLPGELGLYEIGATHPGSTTYDIQDRFTLVGLRLEGSLSARLIPDQTIVLEATLSNPSEQSLTGITWNISNLEGMEWNVVAPTELGPGEVSRIVIRARALVARDSLGILTLAFRSIEGATADVQIPFTVELPHPRLEVEPRLLTGAMVREKQAFIPFTVANTGGADSGPIEITLPQVPWMRSTTPTILPSLRPGESMAIELQLLPDAALPLGEQKGNLAVGNDLFRLAVPFSFNVVSDATGDLSVAAVDEATFFGPDAAKVPGALVSLRDPRTSESLFTAITGPDGIALLRGIPEGPYRLEVSASKHDAYSRSIEIRPGTTNEFSAFLRTQAVRYSWKVSEIDVQEKARIQLETLFETTVPTPVITIEPNLLDLSDIKVDETQVILKVTNRGLIAAQDVHLLFADGGRWRIQPLTEDLGTLPAKSTIEVPVLLQRIRTEIPAAASRRTARPNDAIDDWVDGLNPLDCQLPTVGFAWTVICGPFDVAYWAPLPVIDVGNCFEDISGSLGGGTSPTIYIPPPPFERERPPGKPWTRRYVKETNGPDLSRPREPVSVVHQGNSTYSDGDDCSCSEGNFKPKCLQGDFGIKQKLMETAKKTINEKLKPLTIFSIESFEVKLRGRARLCDCCTEVEGQSVRGLKMSGELGGELALKLLVGKELSVSEKVTIPGFAKATAKLDVQIGALIDVNGSANYNVKSECLLEDMVSCIEIRSNPKLEFGGKIKAEVSAVGTDGSEYSGKASGALLASGSFRLFAAYCSGQTNSASRSDFCFDDFVGTGRLEGELIDTSNPDRSKYANIAVTVTILKGDCNNTPPPSNSPKLPFSETSKFSASTTNSLQGIPSIIPSSTDNGNSPATLLDDTKSSSPRSVRNARKSDANSSVCAQVTLSLEQQAVVTRKAVGAVLEISNSSETDPITNLEVILEITDRFGQSRNDSFTLLPPQLTGLIPNATQAADRPLFGDVSYQLAANSSGSGRWVIIPKDSAAPDLPQEYLVGGMIHYTVAGVPTTAALVPGSVRVYPNPKLVLKYFHQRDVYGDDPFTEVVEPSKPFSLGILVHNQGKGLARDLTITSSQPKIVENLKGLLIDFQVIGTELRGESFAPSLTASFGDIAPGEVVTGRWLLKSSLQGLFLDYKATLEHEDSFGERDISVFDQVEIHELIHPVLADGDFADGTIDFLTNDNPDDDALPDALHLSDGTVASVESVRTALVDSPPSANDLQVQVTVKMPTGWGYLRFPDPSSGQFKLVSVQRPNGTRLSMETNVWTTDRTFLGLGRNPRPEHLVHLVDFNGPSTYTFTYGRDQALVDLDPPSSQVKPLPGNTPAQIPVHWSGLDPDSGSGIDHFDIYVSTDAGPFKRWLRRTTETSAIYDAAAGHHYSFYSVAQDRAGNRELGPGTPDAETLTIGNSKPLLKLPSSASVAEGDLFQGLTTATDADLPRDILTYSLIEAPAGAEIDASTGRIRWQTAEAHGPGVHRFKVRVIDSGTPSLFVEDTFFVNVTERNQRPRLLLTTTRFAVDEGSPVDILVSGEDPDLPTQPLRFRLANQAPIGMSIDPITGRISWRPSEDQGGRTHVFSVEIFDEVPGSLADSAQLAITVAKVNSPPTLAPTGHQVAHEGVPLELNVEASDSDLPVNPLKFILEGTTPGNAQLSPDGRFTWIPTEFQAPGEYEFTIRVEDTGTPVLSSSRTFGVSVKPIQPGFNLMRLTSNGQFEMVFKGESNRDYRLESSPNLLEWETLRRFRTVSKYAILQNLEPQPLASRFYRALIDNP